MKGLADNWIKPLRILCRQAGFKGIVLRGDTDFSQTKFLDAWDDQPDVSFVFGMDAHPALVERAEPVPSAQWALLQRQTREVEDDERREKQPRIKHELVVEKGYRNIELEREDLAEITYRPAACSKEYRLSLLRKTIRVTQGAEVLMPKTRYYFYITNLKSHTMREVVKEANGACIISTGLYWSLKAWFALVGGLTPTTFRLNRLSPKDC